MDGAHDSAGAPAAAAIVAMKSGKESDQRGASDRREHPHRQEGSAAAAPGVGEFQELFAAYYRPVRYYFANRGFSVEECFDLAQETFLKAFKGHKDFRGDASVRTWIFQIANNVWLNEIRRRNAVKRSAKEVSIEDAFPLGKAANPSLEGDDADQLDGVLAEERAEILRQALEGLPPQMRRCIFLRIDQDLKYREIADLMHLSIETVKSHLHQARQRLKQGISDYFEEAGPE